MENYLLNKKNLLSNIENVIDKDLPLISNLSNLSRVFFESFPNTLWSGFYLTKSGEKNLILGPFQGPLACFLVPFGKGVCGTSAAEKRGILVTNVHEFPGHIACSSRSNSEIVVPIIKNDRVVGVIDLDSDLFNNYDDEDMKLLEMAAKIISEIL